MDRLCKSKNCSKCFFERFKNIIPSTMHLELLKKIHEVHMGISKCHEQAKKAVWWLELSKQIQDMVENCQVCLKHKFNWPDQLCPIPFFEFPWQEL